MINSKNGRSNNNNNNRPAGHARNSSHVQPRAQHGSEERAL